MSAVRRIQLLQENQSNAGSHVNSISHLAKTESQITSINHIFHSVCAAFSFLRGVFLLQYLVCVCFCNDCIPFYVAGETCWDYMIIMLRCVMTEGRHHPKDRKKHTHTNTHTISSQAEDVVKSMFWLKSMDKREYQEIKLVYWVVF